MVKKVKNIHMHFLREIPGIIEQKIIAGLYNQIWEKGWI